MSTSISSIGSYTPAMMGMTRQPKPDSNKLAADLFAQIDTSGKGYIEQSDLETAFQQVASTDSTTSTDELFSSLDSDGDGKVTESELSSGLKSLMDSLDTQFDAMRMADAMSGMNGMAGMNGMPPPPPPESDQGFTKDELQSQISEIGSTDSQRADFLSNIVDNFDSADANGDGRVTFEEAMAFDKTSSTDGASSTSTTSSNTTDDTSSSSSTAATTDAQLAMRLMQLMGAYGLFDRPGSASVAAA